MTERHIRPTGRKLRIFLAFWIGLYWLSLLVNTVLLVFGVETLGSPWWLIWEWLLGLMLLVAVSQNLRGGVVVREDGVLVDNGLGRVQQIDWEQIDATRPPRPPIRRAVIERKDDPDIFFGGWSPLAPPGMTPGQFRELDELISQHRTSSKRS
jgi:hypothetical protein